MTSKDGGPEAEAGQGEANTKEGKQSQMDLLTAMLAQMRQEQAQRALVFSGIFVLLLPFNLKERIFTYFFCI